MSKLLNSQTPKLLKNKKINHQKKQYENENNYSRIGRQVSGDIGR